MKILLVGSGGREHALAWRLAQSPQCEKLYCAPGNAGIAEYAEQVPIAAEDIDGLVKFAGQESVDLVVIGPEAPLVSGLVDRLRKAGIPAFGPDAAAARLEGSKAFMKDLCARHGLPTAAYGRFTDIDNARAFIARQATPLVVKADGLAAGKGVIIAQTHEEAEEAAASMLSGDSFGAAGKTVIIEEFLAGQEISYFAIADGRDYIALASAQDYKRAHDNDTGPNTGGMGAISPAPAMNNALEREIEETIIRPVIDGMAKEGCSFSGMLFAGLMLVDGKPYVLEFNTRFGDPECQTLMMRLDSDLADLLATSANGQLAAMKDRIKWRPDPAICVVMAAKGYPGPYVKNTPINGLEQAAALPDIKIFHAGTAKDEAGQIISAGGRVLGITATGPDMETARHKAYTAIARIGWAEGFCRSDIGGQPEKSGEDIKISISH